MDRYRQVFEHGAYVWPSGLPRAAATFGLTPEAFTARTGIPFSAGLDDLDYFRAVGIELRSGRRVLLIWYERAPVRALTLDIDSADDPAAARAEVMEAFGLTAAEVTWVPDDDVAAS